MKNLCVSSVHRIVTGQSLLPFALLAILWASCGTGCAAKPTISRIDLQAQNYDQVFDAAIDALKYERFSLDRVDRRLGVITTQPRDAGAVVEPWKFNGATAGQSVEATLHSQRRVVRINFRPTGEIRTTTTAPGDDTADDPTGMSQVAINPPPLEPASHPGRLTIELSCQIERQHLPGRRVETSSMRHSSMTSDPSLARRGIRSNFWEPIGRDAHLEQRILNRLANMAGDAAIVHPFTTEPTSDEDGA